MQLAIAYFTNRKNPRIEWFFISLLREFGDAYYDLQIIVIDFWAELPGRKTEFEQKAGRQILHVTPKPTPWQGAHRLTDHDAFAAANARNTAIVLCKAPYLVCVDDVSVLVNGWKNAVMEGLTQNRVVAGCYRKVLELEVDTVGNLVRWLPMPYPHGRDNRWQEGRNVPVECAGNWLYGCSFAAPLEVLLAVNGFDECLDGLSFEDVCFGIRLSRAGNKIWFDQRMLTFESEEAHHNPEDVQFKRHNRPIAGFQDCAWEMLNWVYHQPPLARGTPDLRAMRKDVLAGSPFPNHAGFFIWPDGKNLLGE